MSRLVSHRQAVPFCTLADSLAAMDQGSMKLLPLSYLHSSLLCLLFSSLYSLFFSFLSRLSSFTRSSKILFSPSFFSFFDLLYLVVVFYYLTPLSLSSTVKSLLSTQTVPRANSSRATQVQSPHSRMHQRYLAASFSLILFSILMDLVSF